MSTEKEIEAAAFVLFSWDCCESKAVARARWEQLQEDCSPMLWLWRSQARKALEAAERVRTNGCSTPPKTFSSKAPTPEQEA